MGTMGISRHYNLEIDGSCGNGTDNFIRDFQKENKLVVDGRCGGKTRRELKR